jgi:hypothetical protein
LAWPGKAQAKDRSLRQRLQGDGVHPVEAAAGCDLFLRVEKHTPTKKPRFEGGALF